MTHPVRALASAAPRQLLLLAAALVAGLTACGDDPAADDAGAPDAGLRDGGGEPDAHTPDDAGPDASADASSDAGPAEPVLVPVIGNVDPSTIVSFTRVSFVLEDGEYTYFRVFDGDTFVSAVTSTMAVGRFVNESGTLDSFVLDLATGEARVFRLPDATGVWIADANEAGVIVGSAERVRPGDTEPSTFAFRHDLETGTTTETSSGEYSTYLALREDGSALLTVRTGDVSRQYIEDRSGSRIELVRRGFEGSFSYLGITQDDRIFGYRDFDAGGGLVSTLTADGLVHRFFDVVSAGGELYRTFIFAIDSDGAALVRYEVPTEGFVYGTVASLDAEPVAPPPAHPIFLDPALAEVTYNGMRWRRIWGVATYYGE